MKELTLKEQGELYYTISARNPPRLRVDPGETVRIETEDAFSGQVRKDGDRRDVKAVPYPNPQSGPIYVNGAESGDCLAVKIEGIEPLIGQGATRTVSFWYTSKFDTELAQRFLNYDGTPHGTKICPIRDGKVYFDKFVLPYRPMIGTLSTADPVETYLTWFPGPHGGNMDIAEITSGSTVYLPVRVAGALLHVGDAHAIQGDGELSGAAVEMPSRTTLKLELRKRQTIAIPRLENDEMLYTIASTETGRGLEDAIRLAFLELSLWIEKDHSIDRWLAFQLLTFTARIKVGNFWTVAVGISKSYLRDGMKR
jgi:acetamidase/formamidase